MITEAQIVIIELQIDDIQDAKYEMAKHIKKITAKHIANPTKEFIKENNFTEIKKNPINIYQREIKQLIKS